MSAKMFTPVNQVRLTNVAVVRMKKCGKRFEIACYKNKVMNWRNKIEKDLDEVLQSRHVYNNVSKGVLAKKTDLGKAFGTDDEEKVCIMILGKGQLQVSQKERQVGMESKARDLATTIAQKCINSETKRPFPVNTIEQALKEVNYVVKPNKSTKAQALAAIPVLQKLLPIERAQMRLRLQLPGKGAKEAKAALSSLWVTVEEEEFSAREWEATVLIDPGTFRAVTEGVAKQSKGQGTVEVLDLQVRAAGDQEL